MFDKCTKVVFVKMFWHNKNIVKSFYAKNFAMTGHLLVKTPVKKAYYLKSYKYLHAEFWPLSSPVLSSNTKAWSS